MKYNLDHTMDEGMFFTLSPFNEDRDMNQVIVDNFGISGPVELPDEIVEELRIAKELVDDIECKIIQLMKDQNKGLIK